MDYPATLAALRRNEVCVFPTETFYGLGCNCFAVNAVQEILRIKARPLGKALPLIVGGLDQLRQVAPTVFTSRTASLAALTSPLLARLVERFWPGPLTILLPATTALFPEITAETGFVAVRWTSHPLAAQLCLELGRPLVASSANRSGQPPAGRPDELDITLCAATAGLCADGPQPRGGLPSTLVALCGPLPTATRLEIRRHGAIAAATLEAAGFALAAEAGV